MTQNSTPAVAKTYFSTADYYSQGQELTGRWRGEGARLLGLDGEIRQTDWDALCDNRDPRSGKPLTVRRRTDRTVGYDFTFDVPKSVSLLYGMTRDERILDAFRGAVNETMQEIEAEMATRVRKSGKNEDRQTGNIVFGEYIHFTSRPVDGVPDPQLHAHCFTFNVTFDREERRWKAGQFRQLKRDAPYYEAAMHSRLAQRLGELGLPSERTKEAWELAGVDRTLIEKFSRRTKQIEQLAEELGIDDAQAKGQLGATTREKKQKDISLPELQGIWRDGMTPDEQAAIAALAGKLGGESQPTDAAAAQQAMDYAIEHVFERKSVAPERELLATALKHSVGQATLEQIQRQAAQSSLLLADRNGRRMATTRGVLEEESRVIKFAREGRGTCKPLGRRGYAFKRNWLNPSQQAAVRHVLESPDRVIVVRGAAGVGKTSLMQEAVEAIEAGGMKVFAFAPTADASRGVLRSEGFNEADTVARLLADENLQRQIDGQLLWIDEAGLLGARTTADLFALADKLNARILFTGDRRQHGSVARGAMLRLLEEEAGIVPAEVKEIQRQKDQYKAAVKALSEGRVGEGFARLEDLGWIREIEGDDRYWQLAADYVDTLDKGKSALVVSPTHAEGQRITAEIRQSLGKRQLLGNEHRTFQVLQNANLTEAERSDEVNYLPGDVLQFHQNAKGYRRGQRINVDGKPLPLEYAKRFTVFHAAELDLAAGDLVRITHNGFGKDGKRLDNGSIHRIRAFDEGGNIVLQSGAIVDKNFGHLTHGYTLTSHASQGKTVDRVFIAQSSQSFPASSREQFYVSCSRGRESATIYCDDKEALREAVSDADDRVNATELFNIHRRREMFAREQREVEQAREREARNREEFAYERV